MGLTWEEAEVAALNRQEWSRNVAQCVHLLRNVDETAVLLSEVNTLIDR